MRKLTSKEVFWTKRLLLVTFGIFFFSFMFCTSIPHIWKSIGNESTAKFSVGSGKVIHLPKAVIASACTADKSRCINNVLLILGEIDEGTKVAIDELGKRHSSLAAKTVCFRSPGGDMVIAAELGMMIKDAGLDTCLADLYVIDNVGEVKGTLCNSACPWILLAGGRRIQVGHEFSIGLHHPGGVIDFCFCKFKITSPINWNSLKPVRGMLDHKPSSDLRRHLAVFKRSQQTDFSGEDMLNASEWEEYAIFSTAI